MAAVQHEPVAEKVVQFLPAPPPPLTSSLLPFHSSLTLPLVLFTVDMVFFFFFFFFPLFIRLTKALPFCLFFLSPLLAHAFSYEHTHFCLQQSFSLTLPGAVCPPLPSLTPRLPPLLPGQFLSSGRRQSAGVFRLLLHQRAGSRGVHGSTLSLSLTLGCLFTR